MVITGPTACGKTKLGVELSRKFCGEVVSADSMQVYREMEIATAVPDETERAGVIHHMMGVFSPEEECSVERYAAMAREAIAKIHKKGKLPVLVGGTGLYIAAVVDGTQYDKIPWEPKLRRELSLWAEHHTPEELHERLREVDKPLSEKLHPNDKTRILRALEVFEASGIPMSQWQAQAKGHGNIYDTLMVELEYRDRAVLYERINRRVDEMVKQGLVQEAKRCRERHGKTAVQAIGHKELEPYFTGESTLEDCLNQLRQATRRYAKRQMTWFRARPNLHRFYGEDGDFSTNPQLLSLVRNWINL